MEPTLAVMERAGTALGLPEPKRSPAARISAVTKQVALARWCAQKASRGGRGTARLRVAWHRLSPRPSRDDYRVTSGFVKSEYQDFFKILLLKSFSFQPFCMQYKSLYPHLKHEKTPSTSCTDPNARVGWQQISPSRQS
jgi:hypothetical protein